MNSMLTQNFRMKWEQMLANLTPDEHRAMAFLRDHLPESDLDCYPPELFLQFAGHALALREKAAWCGALDCELKMKEQAGVASRCMPLEQEKVGETCVCCGKPAKHMIYWGVAY